MSLSLALAMTTAPRGTPTLDRSIASLRAAGFDHELAILEDAEKVGAFPNWVRAVRHLLDATDADWLMVLQDDTTWASGSRAVLEREILALGERARHAGLLSPFLVNKIARELAQRNSLRPGWHPSQLGYHSGGALCYILPRPSAVQLLADDVFNGLLREHRKNIDRWVPGRFLELGRETLFRYPSLINHTLGSGNSSIKPKKPHDTAHWRAVAC